MTAASTVSEVLRAWPLAFLVGVAVGLGLASRYRIVRAAQWVDAPCPAPSPPLGGLPVETSTPRPEDPIPAEVEQPEAPDTEEGQESERERQGREEEQD